jgi:hypothetical protein
MAGEDFAAMLAGVEPEASDASASEVEGGMMLPTTGNALPVVVLAVVTPSIDQQQPLPAAAPDDVLATDPTPLLGEPPQPLRPGKKGSGALQSVFSAALPVPTPMGTHPAPADNMPLPPVRAVATSTDPGVEGPATTPLDLSSSPVRKQPDIPGGHAEVRQAAPNMPSAADQAPLPTAQSQAQAQAPTLSLPPQSAAALPAMPTTAPAAPVLHGQLETLIDSLVQARESGRAARGEIVLRHAEFGAIAVSIDPGEGDLLARISSRDPGFAPAAQAALADRSSQAVAASTDSQAAQNRPQDGGSSQGHARDTGFASQQERSGTGREQRSPAAPQPQTMPTQHSSTEQETASSRDGSLLA